MSKPESSFDDAEVRMMALIVQRAEAAGFEYQSRNEWKDPDGGTVHTSEIIKRFGYE